MTPRAGWRKKYRGWGAMTKLRYMEKIARETGNADPLRKRGSPDLTVGEMEMTVGEFYRHTTEQVSLPDVNLDSDLAAIFNASKRKKTSEPAGAFLRKNRKALADHIAAWTSMQRRMVRKLMEAVEKLIAA